MNTPHHEKIEVVLLLIDTKVSPILHEKQYKLLLVPQVCSPSVPQFSLSIPSSDAKICLIEYTKLVEDNDPHREIDKEVAELVSGFDVGDPFCEEEGEVGSYHDVSFVQKFKPICPLGVEWPLADVILK